MGCAQIGDHENTLLSCDPAFLADVLTIAHGGFSIYPIRAGKLAVDTAHSASSSCTAARPMRAI
jgi:hypothetical protein